MGWAKAPHHQFMATQCYRCAQAAFELVNIHQVERKPNKQEPSKVRFLIELDVRLEGTATSALTMRLSRYVYRPAPTAVLCDPAGFQWKKTAIVHVVIPVKNQGPWVMHVIENIRDIVAETGDQLINLVLVDYSSDDIDVKSALAASGIRHTFIHGTGAFSRAHGVQLGIDSVTDPTDVVFACDLHLDMWVPAVSLFAVCPCSRHQSMAELHVYMYAYMHAFVRRNAHWWWMGKWWTDLFLSVPVGLVYNNAQACVRD